MAKNGLVLYQGSETMSKTLRETALIGQKGVALIEKIVLAMGWVWYPRGQLETGIDGTIEIRDPDTGKMTSQILLVQSKAGKSYFRAETETSFEFLCDQSDLQYWMQGNVPVLLVVSSPDDGEAYWVSIKDHFKDLSKLKSRKILFDKSTQQFNAAARPRLEALTQTQAEGAYFPPARRTETLYSNLLTVTGFGERLYVAPTSYRSGKEIFERLKEVSDGFVSPEWIVRNKMIISFHNLESSPWNEVCDSGAIETFDTDEWAHTDDLDRRYEFIDLLKRCLSEKTFRDLQHFRDGAVEYLYFRPTKSLALRSISYKTVTGRTQDRIVFQAYKKKSDPDEIAYYKHFAFEGKFCYYDESWYLEITPTQHYTHDGETPYRYREDQLSGIKRLERNQHVLGQIVMWAYFLTKPPTMFEPPYNFLQFGELLTFEVNVGIDDDMWLPRESDDEDIAAIDEDMIQGRLF